ncbi:MAG: hypothetical protein K2F64_05125 [Muribaculaceae bacterium]|nr:hypothetical protein [Muribaculaceae bacterium]
MKRIFFLTFATFLLASCSQDDPDKSFKRATPISPNASMQEQIATQNEAALKLFAEIYDNSPDAETSNVGFSPLSYYSCIGMVANGAEDETLKEMKQMLGYKEISLESINENNRMILENFKALDPKVTFNLTNSFWYHHEVDIYSSFKNTLTDFYKAKIEACDFASPLTIPTINSWIEKETQGKIKDFLNKDEHPEAAIAINALYFKAPWVRKFDKSKTFKSDFTRGDGMKEKVDMMSEGNGDYLYNYLDGIQTAILSLGSDLNSPAFSIAFFLPEEGMAMNDFLKKLNYEKMSSLIKGCVESEATKGTMPALFIPRFTCQYETYFKDILRKKGITKPFDKDAAQFTALGNPGDDNFYLDEIKQKIFFSVDEDGAEGAAATGTSVSGGIHPTMYLNRPFVYVVRENATGTIVFMGAISNPNKTN